jgi:NAD(P)-dependent dehydrogenase (short-subunit alcohol dehydrogenase family)
MKQKILITGLDTELKAKIVKQFLDAGYLVAVAIINQDLKPNTTNKNLIEITWNHRSPLSAKDIILNSRNKLNGFEEALIILSSQNNNKPIHEVLSSDIENTIDTSLKGNLFIIKEIILYFQKTGKGNISLINDIDQSEILSPLNAVGSGGLAALVKSLFASYVHESFTINLFSFISGELESYTEYIFKGITEKTKSIHGKIFKFQERGIPFSFPIQKKR